MRDIPDELPVMHENPELDGFHRDLMTLDTSSWLIFADWLLDHPEKHTYDAQKWGDVWRKRAAFVSIVLPWLELEPLPSLAVAPTPLPGVCFVSCDFTKCLFRLYVSFPWRPDECERHHLHLSAIKDKNHLHKRLLACADRWIDSVDFWEREKEETRRWREERRNDLDARAK